MQHQKRDISHTGKGLLAQLVQSIWFTPRGSGVRIPQGPQTPQEIEEFFLVKSNTRFNGFLTDQYQNGSVPKRISTKTCV